MQKAIFDTLRNLKAGDGSSFFESAEFGRIALNGGFEFTVRDRLLDPLHTKVKQVFPNNSIVSEYSRHGYKNGKKDKFGKKDIILLADMACLEGPMSILKPPCNGIIELKANYSSQLSEIKKRTNADFDKWFNPPVAPPNFPYYYLHIIVEVVPDEKQGGYFPKHPRIKKSGAKDLMNEIQGFFNGFGKGCTLYSITNQNKSCSLPLKKIEYPAFKSKCTYPGFSADITTHFFLLEKKLP